jgi:hypothetical protein
MTLSFLRESDEQSVQGLPATIPVKYLQAAQLHRAIMAVGMFSLFEGILQNGLNCAEGFSEANKILAGAGELALKERFSDFQLTVNVLKHGRGRSYDALVAKAASLPFRILLPGETAFDHGAIDEVATLIEVDDKFVRSCSDLIREVSEVIRKASRDYYF